MSRVAALNHKARFLIHHEGPLFRGWADSAPFSKPGVAGATNGPMGWCPGHDERAGERRFFAAKACEEKNIGEMMPMAFALPNLSREPSPPSNRRHLRCGSTTKTPASKNRTPEWRKRDSFPLPYKWYNSINPEGFPVCDNGTNRPPAQTEHCRRNAVPGNACARQNPVPPPVG